MKQTKINFIEWNNNVLMNSLKKIDFNIILIIILDAAFYSLAASSYFLWDKFMKLKAASVNLPSDPNELAMILSAMGPAKAQQLADQVKSYYFLLVFSFIALIILVIFLAGIFKSVIWAKTSKTKVSLKFISGFLLLNILWLGFWAVITFLISYMVQQAAVPIFFIISFILGMYFANILYPVFVQQQNLKSIVRALKLGTSKAHLFLLPSLIIFLLFFMLVWAASQLKFDYGFILGNLVLIVYAALVRYYVSELAVEAEKR